MRISSGYVRFWLWFMCKTHSIAISFYCAFTLNLCTGLWGFVSFQNNLRNTSWSEERQGQYNNHRHIQCKYSMYSIYIYMGYTRSKYRKVRVTHEVWSLAMTQSEQKWVCDRTDPLIRTTVMYIQYEHCNMLRYKLSE